MIISIEKHFATLTDPQVVERCTYPLNEMLLIALCSIISGGSGYQDMEDFGEEHLDFPRPIYPFKEGIPRHDTFRDLFLLLDPKAFEECFRNWCKTLCQKPSDRSLSMEKAFEVLEAKGKT